MFRKFGAVVPISTDIDKVMKTYTEVFGLAPAKRSRVFEKGRYRQHDMAIGDTHIHMRLDLIQPLDGPEAAGPGGGMARLIQRRGEGLSHIVASLGVPDMEKYCRGLEAKGIKVYWDIPDDGAVTGGPALNRAPGQGMEASGIHPLIHPRSAHGALWEIFKLTPERTVADELQGNNAWKQVKGISVVCRDGDQALKTYTEGLGLDTYLWGKTYKKGGYKEHVFAVGDVALQLVQPLVGPDAANRGGDMARILQRRGEGLYNVTVDVTDPEKYAKGLEAKGVKIDWDEPDEGEVTGGPKRPARRPAATAAQPFINASSAHGVLWKLTRFGGPLLTQ